jgi:hypothetical protein
MDSPCPVPPEHRPLQEYEQLLASWFFVWPSASLAGLIKALAASWLLLLPITVLVASGSWVIRHDPVKVAAAGAVAAILLPLLLLIRQWLGWRYVHRRLLSEQVEYEESGWYDGQVWEKPLAWRQQDLLVAQHQVQPVLLRLRQSAAIALGLMLLGAGLCQAL